MTLLGIACFAVAVPFLVFALEASTGRAPESVTTLAGLVPFVLLAFNARSLLSRQNQGATTVLALFATWSTLALFGLAWGYWTEVVVQSAKILAWGALFFVCFVASRREDASRLVLLLLGLSAIPVALDVLIGLQSGRLDYNPIQGQLSFETTSVNKSMTHVVLGFACLWMSLESGSLRRRSIVVALMLVCALAVVLANARVAHLGLGVCMLAMIWRGRATLVAVGASVALTLAAAPSLLENVLVRWAALISGQSIGTVADRLLWWQRGLEAVTSSSLVFGIGKSFRNPILEGTFPFHSFAVQVIVENGLAGAVIATGAFGATFALLVRSLRAASVSSLSRPLFGLHHILALFAVYIGMSLSENTYLSGFQNWLFWGAAGAMAGGLARQAVVGGRADYLSRRFSKSAVAAGAP